MSSDQDNLLLKFELAAVLIRENETTLLIGSEMLGTGIELTDETPLLLRIKPLIAFNPDCHLLHHLRRHHHQKPIFEVRYGKELVHLTAAPACRDGDAI